jgi:hypothetical protein
MNNQQQIIIAGAARLAAALPRATVNTLAYMLERTDRSAPMATIPVRLLQVVPQPAQQALIRTFLENWQTQAAEIDPTTVATALHAAAAAIQHVREEQQVELVWTGPLAIGVSMRRTDQALLEIIAGARQELLIVSFAVYRIPEIVNAIIKAAGRGVRIRICVEAPEPEWPEDGLRHHQGARH